MTSPIRHDTSERGEEAVGMIMEPRKKSPKNDKKVLTSIHGTYTLSNTRERINRSDELIVKNFLNTLAEVALSVAQRKQRVKDD